MAMNRTNKKRKRMKRGDIVWVDFGQHPDSHIQSGERPCVIVSTDRSKGDVFTVLPGTTKEEKEGFPVHVTIRQKDVKGRLPKKTIFMAEQLVTVDVKSIIRKMGCVDETSENMTKIDMVLLKNLELMKYVKVGGSFES